MAKESGMTTYSEKIEGEPRQKHQPVRFDSTDGFIGINQYNDIEKLSDRILLSPTQAAELVKFIEKSRR